MIRTSKFPWAWTSPESLRTRKFTSASDIWSLGVTFWEILTRGALPYERQLQFGDPARIAKQIEEGKLRVEIPLNKIDEDTATVLESCLAHSASRRPSASEILSSVERLLRRRTCS
mmetsp:Transcript_11120/g.21308  ORF Transcript_11120/g.21308 Transcript_11120/m.21308 type:complete len:116 (-) Transcript_11120:210-557(-)